LASLCALLWGSAYPAIKSGYKLFAIATDDLTSKFIFAGLRFFLAGLMVLAVSVMMKKIFGPLASATSVRLSFMRSPTPQSSTQFSISACPTRQAPTVRS